MTSLSAFADRLTRLLPRLMHSLKQQERNYLTRGVIGIPHLRALEWLDRHRSCTMRQLAHAMEIGQSTLTSVMDRLVALGLARRSRSREDRRVVHVGITAKGRRTLQQISSHRRKMIVRVFSALSGEDRSRYLEIIEKLVGSFAPEAATGPRRASR